MKPPSKEMTQWYLKKYRQINWKKIFEDSPSLYRFLTLDDILLSVTCFYICCGAIGALGGGCNSNNTLPPTLLIFYLG